MLIRYLDGKLRDIPDELAAAIIADPSSDENISDYTSHWVNVIVHGVLGILFDEDKSFDDNVNYALGEFKQADEEKRKEAMRLIKTYHIETKDSDIGMFPASDML